MKIFKLISATAGAILIAGSSFAATLSISGGVDFNLNSDFDPVPAVAGLSEGTTVKLFSAADIVGNGLTLSAKSNLVFTYMGFEAAKANRAFEMANFLFNNRTSTVGDVAQAFDVPAGLVDFTFRTGVGSSNNITNGVGANPTDLSIAFFQISDNSVYALFGDGTGDLDLDDMIVKISAVPLPAGALLMLTAIGGLGFAARRKATA